MLALPPSLAPLIVAGAFLVLLGWQLIAPRRRARVSTAARWRTHLGFVLINLPLERLVQAGLAVMLYSSLTVWRPPTFGLLPLLDLPPWGTALLALILLDFAVWAQHVATHRIALLWRLHRVHHSDRDFDITTALRFHPAELIPSMAWKMGVAYLLGVSATHYLLFELLLSLLPLFNHANIALPRRVDALLRLLIVTPDMHRVHHSIVPGETNSNYGFCLSLWDRLFGTYRAQPAAGHEAMTIGLTEWQDDRPLRWRWAMRLPWL
jgi:sterol desaturase/sphingolipid hydroxylase (fatty acid hydroxylase superfamily)